MGMGSSALLFMVPWGEVNYFSDIDLFIVACTLPGFLPFQNSGGVAAGGPLFLDMIGDAVILYDREGFPPLREIWISSPRRNIGWRMPREQWGMSNW